VAAAIVATVALPRVLPDDAADPVPAGDTGELATHGGPCPDVLPAPADDDGYGFGTSTPADRDPRFASPDRAWVCQYTARDVAPAGHNGAQYEWGLNHTPRRVDDSLLGEVVDGLEGIEVVEPVGDGCNADGGPRYALITSAGGDLTGVVVDDYGCREVRLTDDPFVTAPGDPQDGGTVPGVLEARGLADTLRTWWETSPAETEDGTVPDELRVTCTDDGPQVEESTVAATPAGVVLVVDSTMSKGSYLTYTSDGPSGGDPLSQLSPSTTYPFPPGRVTLGCASPPDMDETGTVTVEVTDPYGFWRSATLADFGCGNGSQPTWIAVSGGGPTPQDAVNALLVDFADALDRDPDAYTAQAAPTGYSGAATQTWVALRRGRPAFSVVVTGTEGSFNAHPDVLCGGRS
jgi:hypothetical protein